MKILLKCIVLLICTMTISGRAHAIERSDHMFNAWKATFWDPNAKRCWVDAAPNRTTYSDFWRSAQEFKMIIAYYRKTGLERQLITDFYAGFTNTYGINWTGNAFNDDIVWMSRACLDAYYATGEQHYLDRAISHCEWVRTHSWDGTYGGGVWQQNQPGQAYPNSKPGYLNFHLAEMYVEFANIYNNNNYAGTASDFYNWTKSHLVSGGAVYNSISASGVDTTEWSYGGGCAISAAVRLFWKTGNAAYINDARAVAGRWQSSAHSAGDGVLTEGHTGDNKHDIDGFKLDLLRGMALLISVSSGDSATYLPWMQANANAVWSRRNPTRDLKDNVFTRTTTDSWVLGSFETVSSVGSLIYFGSGSVDTPAGPLFNVQNGNCIDGGDAYWVKQSAWANAPSQTWRLEHAGGGYYRIVNQSSGKVIDMRDPSGNLASMAWGNLDGQKWRLSPLGGDQYMIISKQNGNVIDMYSSVLKTWAWANVSWQIVRIPGNLH